jgi:membrane fusion protein (multidrug efflux system)
LLLEDGTQYPLPGSLQFTDITVDQGTGSVTLRAIFPNPRFVLLPGMFVRARIEEGVKENAFLVPQVGVTHDPSGKATALVVGADNKVAVRPVQLRGTSGTQWIVEGGLNDGDRVIVAGVQKVQPGAVVQAVDSQTPTAAATPSTPTTTTATAAATSSAPSTTSVAAAAGQAAQPPPATPVSQTK